MLAEYMPYKACETILKVLMSVGIYTDMSARWRRANGVRFPNGPGLI